MVPRLWSHCGCLPIRGSARQTTNSTTNLRSSTVRKLDLHVFESVQWPQKPQCVAPKASLLSREDRVQCPLRKVDDSPYLPGLLYLYLYVYRSMPYV